MCIKLAWTFSCGDTIATRAYTAICNDRRPECLKLEPIHRLHLCPGCYSGKILAATNRVRTLARAREACMKRVISIHKAYTGNWLQLDQAQNEEFIAKLDLARARRELDGLMDEITKSMLNLIDDTRHQENMSRARFPNL